MKHPTWRMVFTVTFALCVACSNPPPKDNATDLAPSSKDVWFAGLDDDGHLYPGTAIVDGKRWEGWPDSISDSDELPKSLETIPASWLPTGHKFPKTWQAYLFNGKKLAIQATGIERDVYGVPGVIKTNLTPTTVSPTIRDFASDIYVSGFAFIGHADMRPFRSMTREEQNTVLPLLEVALWQAETKAIADYAASASDAAADVATFTEDVRRSRRLKVIHAVTAVRSDGENTFYLELEKEYAEPEGCHLSTRFGATLVQNRKGGLSVTTTAAEMVCEKFVSRVPLAVIERGSESCWLVHDGFYEGWRYVLTRPGQWVTDRAACNFE